MAKIKKSNKISIVEKKKSSKLVCLTEKEKKSLFNAQGFLELINRLKSPKISEKEAFNRIFERTIADFSYRNGGDGEKFAFDNCENAEIVQKIWQPQLSQEVIGKFNQTFIGWQNCAVLRQNAFIDKACSIPPEDAMSNGYELAYGEEDNGIDQKDLQDIENRSQTEYGLKDVCVRASINKRVFGQALVIPTFSKEVNMDNPFSLDSIPEGSYTGMSIVDPYWITYDMDSDSISNPASKYFYVPTWYRIAGGGATKSIHRSWVIKLFKPVPDILKPMYFFGGVPLTQQIYEAVYAYEKALNEAIQLLLTKRSFVADANMDEYLMNPGEVERILEATSLLHDNYGIWAKNPGTEIKQMDTTLTGIDEVIASLFQRISSIADMPVTKLLRTQPKGFNSDGTNENKDYNQFLVRIQQQEFLPIINYHNKLMMWSERRKEIPLIVNFNPLDNPDELTKAKIREIDSLTAMHRIASGITDREEERKRLIDDPHSGFSTLDQEPPELSEEDLRLFSTEKDNKGRNVPKEKNNPVRGQTKSDLEDNSYVEQ